MEGFIRVPLKLVNTKPLTNLRHEYRKFVGENLKRWIDWKARQGWVLVSKPTVEGPFDPPTERPGAPEEGIEQYGEHKRYYVKARFKRASPKWIPLDSMLWVSDRAHLYGIDLSKPIHDTGEPAKPQKVIVADEPAHDPVKFAAERRERLGLKREDYLFDGSEKTPR